VLGDKSVGALNSLEAGAIDLRFAIRGPESAPRDIVIVGIDNQSLVDVGARWPFPRSLYGQVIGRLRRAGVRTIVYDLEFTAPTTYAQDNALMRTTSRAGNVVFGTTLVGRNGATNVLGGNKVLRGLRAVAGDAQFFPDSDGTVRRVPRAIEGLGSLAVVAAQRFLGHAPEVGGFGPNGAYIDFLGPPGTIPSVRFSRVLDGHFDPAAVRGKLVVVGATASVLHDLHATSTSPNGLMSGAEMQANAIDTVLRGEPLRPARAWIDTLLILGLALIPALAVLRAMGWPLVVLPVTLAGLLVASQMAFDHGVLLSTVYPALGLVGTTASSMAVAYLGASRERRRLRALFAGQAPGVVDAVLDGTRAPGGGRLANTDIVGGYRLERAIGRGGMGVVYLATQLQLERQVALKLMSPALADEPGFRERFIRESRAAAAVEHPHVIPVYEAGDDNGLLFIAMRYVEGTDLATRLREGPEIGARALLRIGSQVASALDAAHARGVIHRDVKPANVLLTQVGDDEHAYLTDFGVAARAASLSHSAGLVGTPLYVAPEQIEGGPIDGRADVYSLGCLLYELLTGTSPFTGRDVQVLWAHINAVPAPPSEREPSLPAGVDAVILASLAKDPEARFPRAAELVRALAPLIAGWIPSPRRPTAQSGLASEDASSDRGASQVLTDAAAKGVD
jgi:serine/threonine-protein kinase